jgi:hypothetical protein
MTFGAFLALVWGALFAQSIPFPGPGLVHTTSPWTLISHAAAHNAAGPAVIGPINTVGADLIVVEIDAFSYAGCGLSDNQGNIWTNAISASAGNQNLVVWYTHNPTTSAAHTFTDCQQSGMQMQAWKGSIAVGNPLDSQVSSFQTSTTTWQAGSLTPSQNNSLLVAASSVQVGSGPFTYSIGSAYTITDFYGGSVGGDTNGAAAYLLQSIAAASNPAWTINNPTSALLAGLVVFKPQ